jgi:soluble lytic murein transglycosylase-like protein
MLVERTAFDPIIEHASTQHGVDPRLVKAVIQVESGFQSRARSSKGAMGLMQLMPGTARDYRVGRNPYDPAKNIQAGTKYLRTLLEKFEFELPLALAAYNAGEAAVRRFGGIPPYAETQAYVAKILALVGASASYHLQ